MTTRPFRSPLSLFLALCASVAAGAGVHAQNARIVAGSANDGTLRELDFDASSSQVLNTDPKKRKRFQSVVYRNDGANGVHCIAADDLGGRVLFYEDATGDGQDILGQGNPAAPPLPSGLSLDVHDNLFGLTEARGQVDGVWVLRRDSTCSGGGCLPGGYVGPVGMIDSNVGGNVNFGVDRLADTIVVTSKLGRLVPGDLLVLSNNPATLLRYHAAEIDAFLDELEQGGTPAELQPEVFIHPSTAAVPDDERFPASARPEGIAIAPGGNLLIVSGDGVVYNFQPDGKRRSSNGAFVDFLSGLSSSKHQIAAGNQDGQPRAFLSERSSGNAYRYTIEADGTGTLDATVSGLANPIAIDSTTSSNVPTPAGANIEVNASNLMTSRISNVLVSGSTNVTEFLFEDPREAEVATPTNQPLHRSLFLDEISALLPAGIEIPPYVRAMRKGDPVTGTPTFILLLVDTNYGIVGKIDHEADESLVLGYVPSCDDPEPTLQPRLFWVPNYDEPQIPEGPRFINLSTGCGTSGGTPTRLARVGLSANQGRELRDVRSKGVTRSFSLFLIGARDTRLWNETARAQLDGLGMVLATSTCIAQPTLGSIETEYAEAQIDFDAFRWREAGDHLQNIIDLVEGSPSALSSCALNEGGGLIARSLATIYSLGASERDPD